MSDTATQTPAQELMDRALEHAPARGIPFLLGVQNMQHMFGLKHKKDREDYAFEKKLRGDMTEGEVPNAEPEEMGDITVAGDTTTTIHNHYTMPTEPEKSTSRAAGMAKQLIPLAMAAGLGAGGAWLLSNRDEHSAPAVVDTDTDTTYVVEALPGE